MQNDCRRSSAVQDAHTGNGIIAETFKETEDQHYIRIQACQKSFTNSFRYFTPAVIDGISFLHRPRSIPYPDILLRNYPIECRANGFNSIRKPSIQGEYNFMFSAIARYCLSK